MIKIYKTSNYSIFELHQFNREIGSTKKLELSMLKHGWIDAYPMHVVKNSNGSLLIKSGHHRFSVARKLKIPVKYVICENDNVTIHELENATNTWNLNDYLESYVNIGIDDYIYVKEYKNKSGYPLSVCVDLCSGYMVGNNNQGKKFKSGSYKIGNQKFANKMLLTTGKLKKMGIDIYAKSSFLKALSRCISVEQFNVVTFISRVNSNIALMQKQPNVDGYMNMIERIYNKGSKKNSIPLVFLANEEMRKRSPIKYNA